MSVLGKLSVPVVQAPLAGGLSTPALAAAVIGAGGLGFVAAGYRRPEPVAEDLAAVRAATPGPVGVNLFVPSAAEVDRAALDAYLGQLEGEAARYGATVGEPRDDDDGWDAKLALVRAERVPVVSFTFGCPPADVIGDLRRAGTEVWVTVTGVAEAEAARAAGADVLVCQGAEAGGHQSRWVDSGDAEPLGLLALLRLVARAVDTPLVGAGGIADGAALAAVLSAGAAAGQVGTALMRTPEAGTSAAHRAALAADTPTALTRAFTGRTARGIVNRFLAEHSATAPRAYPQVHHATAPLRAAARERGDADGVNLWAGQAHRLASDAPAAEVVTALARDARAALAAAAARLSG